MTLALSVLDQINSSDESEFVSRVGPVFEHSDWIAREAYALRPFSSRDELLKGLLQTLRAASFARKIELIRAHPDLAGRLARAGALTSASTREQAGAGLDRLTPAEAGLFEEYNARYRARFGFPFVICARLSDKSHMLAEFERRLQNEPQREIETALAEIEKIAALRLQAIVPDPS